MEKICCVFLGLLLVLVLGLQLAEGCSCMPAHPQEHFCSSSFAIKATILSSKVIKTSPLALERPRDLFYQARIDEIFKMENDNIKQGDTVTLKTDASGSMCGKTGLQDNKAYVLTGSVSSVGDYLHISLCGFEIPWDQVTAYQLQGFKYFYKLSCSECRVRSQYSWTSYAPSDECSFRFSRGQACETKYSTCLEITKGSCEWLSTSAYKDCIRKRDGIPPENLGAGPPSL